MTKQLLSIREPHFLPGALIDDLHIPLENPGNDPHKYRPIAMSWIHVGLNFEDKAREVIGIGSDHFTIAHSTARRWCHFQKALQHVLNPKVVHCTAEINGHLLASQNSLDI